MRFTLLSASLWACTLAQTNGTGSKLTQLQDAMVDTNGQTEADSNGVLVNTSNSLRAGPRGFNLLEDTSVRKKMIHFDRERAPERVVHALGSGAYGQFESYGDWSNITSACWLQEGAVSEVFTRFSVVVASVGGSETNRDTHGFATKIYSECGNQDLVGNHLSSFFINDGAQFPDLIHAVKQEVNQGFPTGGTAHTMAYDFFTQHPEGTFQLLNVLSDLGIPRDERHIAGNGVHTYRFITASGETMLFKWFWIPMLGHRSLVYDEAQILVGKNGNFQRVDLYNNIEAGVYPEWEFAVQMFPDDGSYTYQGYDLLVPTEIIPFEVMQPIKLGKLTLNRNFNNWFAEPESISFAPSNVVDGITFVPDPLLQWRLMSYDDTSTHRHNSPNGYLLPINKPIVPTNNNYRDGYMQPQIFVGDSISTPNAIGGVVAASPNETLPYAPASGIPAGSGNIGRYTPADNLEFVQAIQFWNTMDIYAQQHTVDALRFELGNVANASVAQSFIDKILNNVDNCMARRVAYGIGATMPAMGSGPMMSNTSSSRGSSMNGSSMSMDYPSLYPLNPGQEANKSNAGLTVAVLANDTMVTQSDLSAMMPLLMAQQVNIAVVASYMGTLQSGIKATGSFITVSSVFYDAVFIGSSISTGNMTAGNGTMSPAMLDSNMMQFVMQAYGHGKAIGALGSDGEAVLMGMGVGGSNDTLGLFAGDAGTVTADVLDALSGPVRFPQRLPVDDVETICGFANAQ